MYVRTYVLYVLYVRTHVCTYICMYACMYVRTYASMYVCTYVCKFITAIIRKNETSAMLENKAKNRNENGSKKTTSKVLHCSICQSDRRQR